MTVSLVYAILIQLKSIYNCPTWYRIGMIDALIFNYKYYRKLNQPDIKQYCVYYGVHLMLYHSKYTYIFN